jgi:hypothetical protein
MADFWAFESHDPGSLVILDDENRSGTLSAFN